MMDNSTDLENYGEVATVETKFTWRIDNISEACKSSEIKSPVFKITIDNVETKWVLYLSENDEESDNDDDDNDDVYLGIYLESLNLHTIKATVDFYMLKALDDREIHRETLEDQEFEPESCWGRSKFFKRKLLLENKNLYTEAGCCTVVCSITTNKFITIKKCKGQVQAEEKLRLKEFEKVEKLLYEEKFSDVVFVVEGKEIPVHKCLVANRSPVFEAMFTHETSEAQNNRVEISDISYSAMRDLLKYIYTGRIPTYAIPNVDRAFMELLVAAEKYGIDNVKHECEKKLSKLLEVDNVFEYLNFADTHNASNLKEKVMEYMVDHGKEIVALPSFKKDCSELHADVVSEVFRALVIKKRKVE